MLLRMDHELYELWSDASAEIRCDCLHPNAVGCTEMCFERMRRKRRLPRTQHTEAVLSAIAFLPVRCECACHDQAARARMALEAHASKESTSGHLQAS